jgi:hypothetical protein
MKNNKNNAKGYIVNTCSNYIRLINAGIVASCGDAIVMFN